MRHNVEVIANHNQQQILTGIPCGVVVKYDVQCIASTKTDIDIFESYTRCRFNRWFLSADHVMFSGSIIAPNHYAWPGFAHLYER